MPCVNCNIDFEGKFCPICGEKKEVQRITFTSIIESVFSGFVEMDKGLLFNLKNLTLYPQKTVLDYVAGKRKYILNPISYAIITIGIYLFLDTLLPKGEKPKSAKVDLYGMQQMGIKLGYFLRSQMKFFWLSFAVYSAALTRLFFRKFNYFEHLAINCFVLGHATILAIITRLFYNKELIVFNVFVYLYMIFLLYKIFKNPKDKFGTKALSFLIIFLSYLLFLGMPFLVVNFILD